ncbi:hypothetical protein GCM10017783_17460 [Deinococcus piscis]|uniref:Uncharacterized protein n=1 Tax=Deinococcus piscis TaxID=394230 RepID=A0ABQ3KD39_9DEIO|nr:hypothetical protein GCM10017783_17460 [Deinococcus piscis]
MLPLLVCGGLSALVLRPQTGQVPELYTAPSLEGCAQAGQPIAFEPGYPDDGATATLREDGFHLLGRSWLRAQACGPGTLTVTGDGDQAGDEPPRLEISLGGKQLASEAFAQPRTVEVAVPEAGELTLAYLNDYYQSEYRLVGMENINLQGPSCAPPITVAPEQAGQWDAELGSAHVVYEAPLVFNLCGDGTLEMKLWGMDADGQFPQVRFEQGGQVLYEGQPSGERQLIRLPVKAGKLAAQLLNPYIKQTEDRNLYLRRVEFTPKAP